MGSQSTKGSRWALQSQRERATTTPGASILSGNPRRKTNYQQLKDLEERSKQDSRWWISEVYPKLADLAGGNFAEVMTQKLRKRKQKYARVTVSTKNVGPIRRNDGFHIFNIAENADDGTTKDVYSQDIYLSHLPRRFMHTVAGHPLEGTYFNPRDTVKPPAMLLKKAFP